MTFAFLVAAIIVFGGARIYFAFRSISGPVDLLAQSMSGVIAIRAALQQPAPVKHLMLAVTSRGIDVSALGAQDRRPMFLAENPQVPPLVYR